MVTEGTLPRDALRQVEQRLTAAGCPDADFDAAELLRLVLGVDVRLAFAPLTAEQAARLEELTEQLHTAVQKKKADSELRLQHTAALTASLSPYGVLARGYAMVQDSRGRICPPDRLQPGQNCSLRGSTHRITCTVRTVEELDESTQKF